MFSKYKNTEGKTAVIYCKASR